MLGPGPSIWSGGGLWSPYALPGLLAWWDSQDLPAGTGAIPDLIPVRYSSIGTLGQTVAGGKPTMDGAAWGAAAKTLRTNPTGGVKCLGSYYAASAVPADVAGYAGCWMDSTVVGFFQASVAVPATSELIDAYDSNAPSRLRRIDFSWSGSGSPRIFGNEWWGTSTNGAFSFAVSSWPNHVHTGRKACIAEHAASHSVSAFGRPWVAVSGAASNPSRDTFKSYGVDTCPALFGRRYASHVGGDNSWRAIVVTAGKMSEADLGRLANYYGCHLPT